LFFQEQTGERRRSPSRNSWSNKMQRQPSRNRSRRPTRSRNGGGTRRLTVDEAFIALFIGAMEANQHVSREEAERAHHIIWSMKRYRHKSGETVDRLIDVMRRVVETRGASATVDIAARALPSRLRPAAFALSADLVLADGKIERAERRFLGQLAEAFGLDPQSRDRLIEAMLIKNSA
jgi:uncharacterized tellurite resistance protein B-like protein